MIKKITFLTCILFSITFYGQKNDPKNKKIMSARISYITEELSLTPKQAEKFWPIYNTAKKEIFSFHRYRMRLQNNINFEQLTDAKAIEISNKLDSLETISLQRRLELNKELSAVISKQQILKLRLAEVNFKRKLLEYVQNKH